ncbi:metalloendopeptidase [Trichonephila clavipes]|nr:metalloendopeptidase [Trichonephila clavipes]
MQLESMGTLDFTITIHVQAEDNLEDFDEKLILTQMSRSKTEKDHILFEGDILEELPDKDSHSSMKALPNKGALWLERIIPYEYHSSVNKSTSDTIRNAMNEWERKTCLKFVPRTTERQFLRFRTDNGGTATAGSDVVQSGRPIFDDFFQHLWPYIDNNMANVVFQMVKRLWLIRIDQ